MENIYKNLGRKIRNYRHIAGMTQEQLGGHSQITQNYLTLVESGKKKPTIEVVKRIAYALEVPLADFFEENPAPEPQPDYVKQIKTILKDMTPKQRQLFMNIIKDASKRIKDQSES